MTVNMLNGKILYKVSSQSWNVESSAQLTREARLADTLVVIGQLDAIETAGGTAGV